MKRLFLTIIAKLTGTPLYIATENCSWVIKGKLYWAVCLNGQCKIWNSKEGPFDVSSLFLNRYLRRIA